MFRIQFETDNAAFEGADLGPEIARILRRAADEAERSEAHLAGGLSYPVRDVNGNTVGVWSLTRG